jgi:ABC-type Mn2+/Zn2+ transport system permease subunit
MFLKIASVMNLAVSMHSYMTLSAFFGVISAASGIAIAHYYTLPPGPAFVIIAGAIFFISILFRR